MQKQINEEKPRGTKWRKKTGVEEDLIWKRWKKIQVDASACSNRRFQRINKLPVRIRKP